MDLHIQTILFDELPQLLRSFLELLTSGNVVEQRWAQELDVLRAESTSKRVSNSSGRSF